MVIFDHSIAGQWRNRSENLLQNVEEHLCGFFKLDSSKL